MDIGGVYKFYIELVLIVLNNFKKIIDIKYYIFFLFYKLKLYDFLLMY